MHLYTEHKLFWQPFIFLIMAHGQRDQLTIENETILDIISAKNFG